MSFCAKFKPQAGLKVAEKFGVEVPEIIWGGSRDYMVGSKWLLYLTQRSCFWVALSWVELCWVLTIPLKYLAKNIYLTRNDLFKLIQLYGTLSQHKYVKTKTVFINGENKNYSHIHIVCLTSCCRMVINRITSRKNHKNKRKVTHI